MSYLQKFLLAMCSAWVVGPLGVLYLYVIGWGGNTVLIATLLAASAIAPIQLMMNEFLATGLAAGHFRASHIQLVGLFILAVSVCAAGLWSEASVSVDPLIKCIIALFWGVTVMLSYGTAFLFYRAIAAGKLSGTLSGFIAAVPGITTCLVYIAASELQRDDILAGSILLPALAQFAFMAWLARADGDIGIRPVGDTATVPIALLARMVLSLGLCGIITVVLRNAITASSGSYAALLLVGLNMVGTSIITFARSAYLTHGRSNVATLFLVAASIAVLGALLIPWSKALFLLGEFLALQMAVAGTISIGRKLGGGWQTGQASRESG
jgi:hypothetical protein